MTTATLPASNIDTGDRLSFTFFLAVAIHAIIILGITFNADFNRAPPPTLEITLATHKTSLAPEKADFLAQFDQQASGTGERAQQMTTDKLAPLEDNRIRENNPTPQIKAAIPVPRETLTTITTKSKSQFQATLKTASDEQEQIAREGRDLQDSPLSAEIASLRAKLDQQRRAIAKKPRIRRITSVATKASVDADYLNKWTSKVEFVGNRNFPDEAITQKIFGKLRLATTLRANGTIHRVEILQSSGHSILDDAAVQIVHLASPYQPFPLELRKDVDQLEIIRTWHFELSGLSTSANNK